MTFISIFPVVTITKKPEQAPGHYRQISLVHQVQQVQPALPELPERMAPMELTEQTVQHGTQAQVHHPVQPEESMIFISTLTMVTITKKPEQPLGPCRQISQVQPEQQVQPALPER